MNYYENLEITCFDKSHGRLEYCGGENYRCPICGDTWHDEKYDTESSDEYMGVRDAAEIWDSYGRDENLMFGYSEEDLLNALDSLSFRRINQKNGF